MGQVILVTGASSGIGRATAQLLAERGHLVLGTSRNIATVAPIPGVEFLPLDVRSDASVGACVDMVLQRAGRLDVLVNNAGYVLSGAVEEVSPDEALAQFETNFFGAVRMARAVLPIMRRQGGGQIINISSVAGLVPLPFWGYYSASKAALEALTEALRYEVKPFRIRVSLVEPGPFKTELYRNQQGAERPIAEYDPWRERVAALIRENERAGEDPQRVAECVLRIVASPSPRLRYPVGRNMARNLGIHKFMPGLFEMALTFLLKLGAKP